MLKGRHSRVDVVHEHGLGDLEDQPRRWKAGPFERLGNPADKTGIAHLISRKVDVQFNRIHIKQIVAGAIQNPVAEREDQP